MKPLSETAAWKAAASLREREAAAIAWVRRGQRIAGCEHIVVLGSDGSLLWSASSGETAAVFAGDLGPGIDAVFHHSHPDEVSLSTADIRIAWRRSRGSEACAYTPDGGVYRGRALIDPERWRRNRQSAVDAVSSELRVLQRRNRSVLAYLSVHLVNAEMAQGGLLWYRSDPSKAARADLATIDSDMPRLRAIIRHVLAEE